VKLSREELVAHIGRESLTFKDRRVCLRITWSVGVDWAGDAESKVRATASFPSIWHEVDDRSSLEKTPEVFDMLVKKYGVYNACNLLIRLVFSENGIY